ncbi:hypothetical protein [uncultured Pseudacidovorax sp.]|uniref:hypothetical protein n=1 Tax=uncultured Pseudacidovorax sp. TaxID=679313 RepID=UPI0025FFB466|nr:hypothetical protein [uncultured Pseudacidovorax sp.]
MSNQPGPLFSRHRSTVGPHLFLGRLPVTPLDACTLGMRQQLSQWGAVFRNGRGWGCQN